MSGKGSVSRPLNHILPGSQTWGGRHAPPTGEIREAKARARLWDGDNSQTLESPVSRRRWSGRLLLGDTGSSQAWIGRQTRGPGATGAEGSPGRDLIRSRGAGESQGRQSAERGDTQ